MLRNKGAHIHNKDVITQVFCVFTISATRWQQQFVSIPFNRKSTLKSKILNFECIKQMSKLNTNFLKWQVKIHSNYGSSLSV